MRLGIVSDTHGELDNLRKAANVLTKQWQVDVIVHLGDECEDVAVLKEYPVKELIQVHGVYCQKYQDPVITNRLIKSIEGYRILFSHTDKPHRNDLPNDPDPEKLARNKEVDIICYGHSHIPVIRQEDSVLWLNPGHLKSEDKKGHAPSFAVLELTEQQINVKLIDLNTGEILQSN